MDELETLEWGIVPRPVRAVLTKLEDRLADALKELAHASLISERPKSFDDAFHSIAHGANVADRVSTDLRSLFNAYVHRFHRPKPSITDLARAQDTVIQSFARRYTTKTVAALEALISAKPDLAALRDGIPSLGFDDYWALSETLDDALMTASKDPNFEMWRRNPR